MAYVFCAPEDDHAFEERGAGTARTDEEIEVGAGDRVRGVLAERETVLCGCDFKEAHFAPHVIQRRDQEVHGPVHGMELRIGGHR